jgi:6-phosphofructokinase 2
MTLNPAVDTTAGAGHVAPDEKLRLCDVRRDPGGGGINVARVVHELGGEATAGYLAGGPDGAILEDLLRDTGIEQVRVDVDGRTRENLTVSDRSSDRQYRFVMPGPAVTAKNCRTLLDGLMNASHRYLVASGSLPPGAPDDWYAEVAEACGGSNTRLIVDTSGRPLQCALGAGVFLIKPNLRELAQLAGREIEDDRDLEEVARGLVADGKAEVVVVSMGSGGASVVTDSGCTHIRAPSVPIRSRVGAGDSAVGGIVLALERGDDVEAAVRLGVAAGAAAVMTPGTELCRKRDVERIASGMSH